MNLRRDKIKLQPEQSEQKSYGGRREQKIYDLRELTISKVIQVEENFKVFKSR